jgi:uncharacterized protein
MAGKLVISNTTPLINFAEIGRLDILETIFGILVIPPAVEDELTAKATLFPEAAAVPSRAFVRRMSPTDRLLVKSFASHVHQGEAECLALAMENPGSLLLLDDLAARDFATANNLLFTGTLGCIALAKQRGLISSVGPLLKDLKEKSRFWISDALQTRILREASEI